MTVAVTTERDTRYDLFCTIYASDRSKVLNYITLLARIDRETAADLTHDTFIKFWEAIPRLLRRSDPTTDPAPSWLAYLYRIAINTCHDYTRHQATVRRFTPMTAEWPGWEHKGDWCHPADPDPVTQPERHTCRQETTAAVRCCLSRLPAHHRTVLVLREHSGLNYNEIGETLGMSRAAVKSRMFRARQAFAQLWHEEHDEAGS